MATRAIPDPEGMPAPLPATGWLPAFAHADTQIAPPTRAQQPPLATPQPAFPETAAGFLTTSRRPRLTVALAVLVLHGLAIGALVTHRFVTSHQSAPVAMQVLDIAAPPPPPAAVAAPPPVLVTPQVTVPPPVIEVEQRAPSITAVVAAEPPPVAPAAPVTAAVAKGTPAPAVVRGPAEVAAGDLSTTMITMVPPRYPYESRRRKEQGTVVLDVLLATDGSVDKVSVRTSSGFARLDTAAIEAVRHWRWSPMIRDGVAVAVRGLVEIPFLLAPKRGH